MRRCTFWKRGQRARGLGRRHAHMLGRGDGRQRIELVVHAGQRPFDAADLALPLQHVEGMRLARAR